MEGTYWDSFDCQIQCEEVYSSPYEPETFSDINSEGFDDVIFDLCGQTTESKET